MADLLQHSLTQQADANLLVRVYRLQFRMVSSSNQNTVIVDRTGASAIDFALRFAGATQAQNDRMAERLAKEIVRFFQEQAGE